MSERFAIEFPSSAGDLPCTIWKPASREALAFLLRLSGIDPNASLDRALHDLEPIKLPESLLQDLPEEDRLEYERREVAMADPRYGGRRRSAPSTTSNT